MKHNKYEYVKTLVNAKESVLLVGSAGTGKTTLAMQIAEDLDLPFHTMSMTKQTAVSALIGFISINGQYIPSQLRTAYETGGIMLLDELDAADANVLLTLNTIENGFIAFPDGIIKAHKDFRLIATANPFNDHASYTGRSKLDFSTIDRYLVIELERDDELEISLTSLALFQEVTLARKLMADTGLSRTVTMRDSIRIHRLAALGISECTFKDVVFAQHPELHAEFISARTVIVKEAEKASRTQLDCTTIDDLWETVAVLQTKHPSVVDDSRERVNSTAAWYVNIGTPPEGDRDRKVEVIFNNKEKRTESIRFLDWTTVISSRTITHYRFI